MGKRDGEFIIILDIDKVFSVEEVERIQGGNPAMISKPETVQEQRVGV
jgi:hypothetical protein